MGAQTFVFADRISNMHSNDVSKQFVAMSFGLPMSVLPAALQMNADETAICLIALCYGELYDANGLRITTSQGFNQNSVWTIGDNFFMQQPSMWQKKLFSAAQHVRTVLHEYGHYIDGVYNIYRSPMKPHCGSIDTRPFYEINYDMSTYVDGCAMRRSDDDKGWISTYGYLGGQVCSGGKANPWEEWADAFANYVVSGKNFRRAASLNAIMALKYEWLKNNVFQGIEYETDLTDIVRDGCTDNYPCALPTADHQMGHLSCSPEYVWDVEIRIKP